MLFIWFSLSYISSIDTYTSDFPSPEFVSLHEFFINCHFLSRCGPSFFKIKQYVPRNDLNVTNTFVLIHIYISGKLFPFVVKNCLALWIVPNILIVITHRKAHVYLLSLLPDLFSCFQLLPLHIFIDLVQRNKG
jgi:hypothetical protein